MTSKLLLLMACVAAIVIFPHTVELARAGRSVRNDLAIAATATFGTMKPPEEHQLMGVRLASSEGVSTDELGLMVVLSDHCGACDRALEFWRRHAGKFTVGRTIWFVTIGENSRRMASNACQTTGRGCRVYAVDDVDAFRLSSGIGIVPASVMVGSSTACAILGAPSSANWESCQKLITAPSSSKTRPPIVWGEGGQQLLQASSQ